MIADTLLSFIAPHDCLGCMAEGNLICARCRAGLRSPEPRCYSCHAASSGSLTCPPCRQVSALRSVHAAVKYEGIAKDMIWKLKFGRARAVAREMAGLIEARLQLRQSLTGQLRQHVSSEPRGQRQQIIITHAPTATSRVRQRGYDQAALIAKALARDCGLPYSPLLRRTGRQKQVGASKTLRSEQLAQAFYAIRQRRIQNAHIILIDDVVTTGATLEAAASALLAAGARRIDAVVFAQA